MNFRAIFYRSLMRIRPAFIAVTIKKLLHIKRALIETPAGKMLIDPVSVFGQAVLDPQGYEHEMLETLDSYLPRNGIFLDIGANEGFFTLYASQHAREVIAIEPQKRAAECIRNNLKINDITNANIHEFALGKTEELRDFHLANDTNTGSSGFVNMVRYNIPVAKIEVKTLDALMEKLGWPSIDLAKIDIEGAEYELLLGATKTLSKGLIKNIAIELHPKQLSMQGYSSEHVVKLLIDNAYHIDKRAPTLVYSRDMGQACS
jgi:FkbM family methyltransferase